MTAKEYLSQARWLDQRINSLIQELDQWRSLETSMQGCRLAPNYNSNRTKEAPFVEILVKIDKIEREIDDEVDRLVELKLEINHTIDQLSDSNERLLLRGRYLENKKWKDICEMMGISKRTAFRIHGEALEKIPKSWQ